VVTLFVLASPLFFAQTESAIRNAFWQPDELQSGSVIFFTVELNRNATKVLGKFLDKDLLFFRSEKPSVWYSLAGIDLETTPGAYELSIRGVMRGDRATRTLKKVEVGAATFKTGDIDVPENFVTPD
jgi:hypothetical protein